MAISLAQASREFSRQRASTLPLDMASYYQSDAIPMPIPEPYFGSYPDSATRRSTFNVTSVPAYSQPYYYYAPHGQSPQYQQPAAYHELPMGQGFDAPHLSLHQTVHPGTQSTPIPHQSQLSSSCSETSSASGTSPTSWTTTIEPDPLPPHSNPQALTKSQSEAFTESTPVPALRLGKDEVWNLRTGLADFRVTREAARAPSFMSTKPLLTITKTSTGLPVGNVRFHTVTSNSVEMAINGRHTAISHSGVLHLHNRWGFDSTTSSRSLKCRVQYRGFEPPESSSSPERWYWKKDKSSGGAVLEDAKRHGNVLAKMKGDLLVFVKPRLSQESYDEIVVSAIAMAEAARRHKRKSDIADIAGAIGDFTSADGGSGSS